MRKTKVMFFYLFRLVVFRIIGGRMQNLVRRIYELGNGFARSLLVKLAQYIYVNVQRKRCVTLVGLTHMQANCVWHDAMMATRKLIVLRCLNLSYFSYFEIFGAWKLGRLFSYDNWKIFWKLNGCNWGTTNCLNPRKVYRTFRHMTSTVRRER